MFELNGIELEDAIRLEAYTAKRSVTGDAVLGHRITRPIWLEASTSLGVALILSRMFF